MAAASQPLTATATRCTASTAAASQPATATRYATTPNTAMRGAAIPGAANPATPGPALPPILASDSTTSPPDNLPRRISSHVLALPVYPGGREPRPRLTGAATAWAGARLGVLRGQPGVPLTGGGSVANAVPLPPVRSARPARADERSLPHAAGPGHPGGVDARDRDMSRGGSPARGRAAGAGEAPASHQGSAAAIQGVTPKRRFGPDGQARNRSGAPAWSILNVVRQPAGRGFSGLAASPQHFVPGRVMAVTDILGG